MNESNQHKTSDELQTDTSVAEAKRLAARRRFLGRGTAAASGLVIVTLCHQRAFAKKPAPAAWLGAPTTEGNAPVPGAWVPPTTNTPTVRQDALQGSAALCQSLGGQSQVYDVTTSLGVHKVVDCTTPTTPPTS